MAVEKITLNLIPTGETPTIHAAQFDKERAFQIELKEGEDDFSPTGYDIELQVRKVDNNIVTVVPSQVSSNIVTFLTTEQMTACSGTNLAELQISKDNMSIATLHFYLVVQRDVLAGGVTSASAIHDLEDQIAAIVPEVIGDDYYTADQVDEKIAEIPTFDPTNYYDKTETNGLLSQKANTSSLSTVAFTGSYDDLVDHPVIPDVSDYYTKEETYSQSEVNTLLSTKADISSLSTVATSGSYDDLSDKPTIPTNAEQLPIESGSATNTKDYIDDKTALVKSASGSLIHITDGGDNIPLKSCKVTIDPDLSGHTQCVVSVADSNNVVQATYTISFGTTVYGGEGDVTTGEFTSELGLFTYDGSADENWGNNGEYFYIGVPTGYNTSFTVITNKYEGIAPTHYSDIPDGKCALSTEFAYLNIHDSSITSLADFKTALSNKPLQVLYKAQTPTSLTLTPVNPKTISGVNNIYNDCGDTAIEYFTSSADDIAELIRALM